jgi:hypothetical protein
VQRAQLAARRRVQALPWQPHPPPAPDAEAVPKGDSPSSSDSSEDTPWQPQVLAVVPPPSHVAAASSASAMVVLSGGGATRSRSGTEPAAAGLAPDEAAAAVDHVDVTFYLVRRMAAAPDAAVLQRIRAATAGT